MDKLLFQVKNHVPFDSIEQTHKLHTIHLLDDVASYARQKVLTRSFMKPGHVTGSAVIANPAFTHMLVIFHPYRCIWMQPGGHADGDTNIERVAIKELGEETGFVPAQFIQSCGLFDIDAHQVPANPKKNEGEHLHYDLRYLFVVDNTPPLPVSPEKQKVAWKSLNELKSIFPVGGGRHRMLLKLESRQPKL